MTTVENKQANARGLSRGTSFTFATLSLCIQLLLFSLFFDMTPLQPRNASALAWVCDTLISCVLLLFVLRKTSPVGLHSPMILSLSCRMIYLAVGQTVFFFMERAYHTADSINPYLVATVALAVVFFFVYYFVTHLLLFHRAFHRYHRRHLLTMTAIATAMINYTVFYLTKLLLFGIDYYMYADMVAWLIASLYFFLVTRDLVKSENGNAEIVLYIMCLFSFLLTHMMIRFSYGFTYNLLPQAQREWIIDFGKPFLVVLTTLVTYLVVRYCFPHIKRIDDNTAD